MFTTYLTPLFINAYKSANKKNFIRFIVKRPVHSKQFEVSPNIFKGDEIVTKRELRSYLKAKHRYRLSPVSAKFNPWQHPCYSSDSEGTTSVSDRVEQRRRDINNDLIFAESFSEQREWSFEFCKHPVTREELFISHPTLFAHGIHEIRKYIKNKNLSEASVPAFEALMRFFAEKNLHQKSLRTLEEKNRKLKESDIAAILVNHLLSQLLPCPSHYFLDKHSMEKPDGCPCGCNSLINYGTTKLGSPKLFNGNADLVMFSSKKALFDIEGGSLFTIATRINENEENGCNIVKAVHREHEQNEECIDVSLAEFKNKAKNWFIDDGPFHQLCKQAISSALYRKFKRSSTLHGGRNDRPVFVPVVGLTPVSYDVALYDPDTDLLLKSLEPMPLFQEDGSLSSLAVIDLWLAVHHSVFSSKLRSVDVKLLSDYNSWCSLKEVIPPEEFEDIVATSSMFVSYSNKDKKRSLSPNPLARGIDQEFFEELVSESDDEFETHKEQINERNEGHHMQIRIKKYGCCLKLGRGDKFELR